MTKLFIILAVIFSLGFVNVGYITVYGTHGLIRASARVPNGHGTLLVTTEPGIEELYLESRQSGIFFHPDIVKENVFIYSKLPAYGGFDIVTVPKNHLIILVQIH